MPGCSVAGWSMVGAMTDGGSSRKRRFLVRFEKLVDIASKCLISGTGLIEKCLPLRRGLLLDCHGENRLFVHRSLPDVVRGVLSASISTCDIYAGTTSRNLDETYACSEGSFWC